MNERIQELIVQSGNGQFHNDKCYPHIGSRTLEDWTKFAELIVRECYEHCKGQVLDKEVADTNELTYNDAVGDCANGLLQHFGVDE